MGASTLAFLFTDGPPPPIPKPSSPLGVMPGPVTIAWMCMSMPGAPTPPLLPALKTPSPPPNRKIRVVSLLSPAAPAPIDERYDARRDELIGSRFVSREEPPRVVLTIPLTKSVRSGSTAGSTSITCASAMGFELADSLCPSLSELIPKYKRDA